MKIILVGGHQKPNFLARSLKEKGHNVIIINDDYEWCKMLANTHEVTCVYGDGTKPFILEDAGAANADMVIALTNKDATNLIVCELAKKQFHVNITFAIVNDPKNMILFKELGVNKCISATQMLADVIEQEAIVDNLKSYLPMEEGKVAVCEVEIDHNSPVINKKIWQIGFPGESNVSCIIRKDEIIIPQGNSELHEQDKVVIVAKAEVIDRAIELLVGRRKK